MLNKDALTIALARFISQMEQEADATHEAEDRPLYTKFLAEAAIIISKAVQDKPIGDDVDTMERLFGHTWLRNEEAYRRIYSAWDAFKALFSQSIHGMTINERLTALGLLADFDKAVEKRDEFVLRGILFKCFLNNDTIEAIIRQQLKQVNPTPTP